MDTNSRELHWSTTDPGKNDSKLKHKLGKDLPCVRVLARGREQQLSEFRKVMSLQFQSKCLDLLSAIPIDRELRCNVSSWSRRETAGSRQNRPELTQTRKRLRPEAEENDTDPQKPAAEGIQKFHQADDGHVEYQS